MTLDDSVLAEIARHRGASRSLFMKALGQVEFERCADDPLYWIDRRRHPAFDYVFTRDPQQLYICRECATGVASPVGMPFDKRKVHLEVTHNKEVASLTAADLRDVFTEIPSTRPFTLMDYMPPLIAIWLTEPILLVEKSRDMMATWLFVALYTWDTIFHQNRQNIVQSKAATSTLDLLRRANFIYAHQPKFLRSVHKAEFASTTTRSGQLSVPSLNSELLGFPQGPDQIRGYHPSGIFVDEAAFQIEAGDAFRTIKPAIDRGGRYTAISSANPGFFQMAVQDRLQEV